MNIRETSTREKSSRAASMSFSGGGERRGLGTSVGFVRWNREMQNNVPAMDTRAINEQAASEVYMYGSFVLRSSGAF